MREAGMGEGGKAAEVTTARLDHMDYEPTVWGQLDLGAVLRSYDLLDAAASPENTLARGAPAVKRLLASLRQDTASGSTSMRCSTKLVQPRSRLLLAKTA